MRRSLVEFGNQALTNPVSRAMSRFKTKQEAWRELALSRDPGQCRAVPDGDANEPCSARSVLGKTTSGLFGRKILPEFRVRFVINVPSPRPQRRALEQLHSFNRLLMAVAESNVA